MATTSQKMIDIKFFVLIRGAFTPPPRIDEPVMKIPLPDGRFFKRLALLPPLCLNVLCLKRDWLRLSPPLSPPMPWAYHAAPTTDNPIHKPMPKSAQAYGDIVSRNCPTYFPPNPRASIRLSSSRPACYGSLWLTLKTSPSPVKSKSGQFVLGVSRSMMKSLEKSMAGVTYRVPRRSNRR